MVDYNLERLKVLIVDDNMHMRSMIRSILYALGVRDVETANDGEDAFKKLNLFAADVVLCDWNMEPMNGLEFVRQVRNDSDTPNPYVSIIMLTGYTDIERVFEARDSGVHEFLAKPVSAEKIYARIKTVIERERMFVKAGDYFGPDRRRRDDPSYSGEDRRADNK
jgi:two-component system, chemotaxis family, chemotaxis protein CheY